MNKINKVTQVISYIEGHLTEKLELDEIAEAVHYSKYYLHRVFRETVGMTIHDYVQRRQLTEAAKLLVFSRKPILDVALLAGYESQQAFATAFREMYKMTPGQFREREEFYPLQLEFRFEEEAQDNCPCQGARREIRQTRPEDIPAWLELVRLTVDGFPHLQEGEHTASLERYIDNRGAFLMWQGGKALGAMMVSRATGSIDFLAVHPLYRRQGVSEQFLKKALAELLVEEVSITTFREGDKADPGHRRTLKKLGFAEAELLVEFGYPTQRMVWQKEGEE